MLHYGMRYQINELIDKRYLFLLSISKALSEERFHQTIVPNNLTQVFENFHWCFHYDDNFNCRLIGLRQRSVPH